MNTLIPLGLVLTVSAWAALDWFTAVPSADLALAALAALAGGLVWHYRPARRAPRRFGKLI